MSTFLISGVNGFIGSHIGDRLVQGGHVVRGLVRKTSDVTYIKGLDLELCYGDVEDRDSLDLAMKGVEIVIHAAALVSDWSPAERMFALNLGGTENIARSAQAHHVKRFVHISSAAVHGFRGFRYGDELFAMPKSIFPYCESKRAAEAWLWCLAKSTDMQITVIRPGNVFGPRDHIFTQNYLHALRRGKFAYVDRGRHWTCPTYVENLVDAIVGACFEPLANGEAFIITDGLKIDWKTLTDRFADELGVERTRMSIPYYCAYSVGFMAEMTYKLLSISRPPAVTRYRVCNAGRDYHFSIEKVNRLLGYRPAVEFGEAVRRTVRWFLEEYPQQL